MIYDVRYMIYDFSHAQTPTSFFDFYPVPSICQRLVCNNQTILS